MEKVEILRITLYLIFVNSNKNNLKYSGAQIQNSVFYFLRLLFPDASTTYNLTFDFLTFKQYIDFFFHSSVI